MKNLEDIFFFVQARLSSQRIKRKMVRPFAGSTLLDISLENIICSIIPPNNFYLSAYEQEIKDIGRKHGVNIFHRSEKSAQSSGLPLSEIFDWSINCPYKYAIMINACAPLLSVQTLNNFIQQYVLSPHSGLLSVFSKKTYFWNEEKECINKQNNQRNLDTQSINTIYEAAHCLYASSLKSIHNGYWMGDYTKNNPDLFIMNEYESLDIDYQWQFNMLEVLYKNGSRP